MLHTSLLVKQKSEVNLCVLRIIHQSVKYKRGVQQVEVISWANKMYFFSKSCKTKTGNFYYFCFIIANQIKHTFLLDKEKYLYLGEWHIIELHCLKGVK